MDEVISFKNGFSHLKSLHDPTKIQQMKLTQLKEAAKEMFELLTSADGAIDGLVRTHDGLNVLRSCIDDFRAVVTKSAENSKSNYADVVKKNVPPKNPSMVTINGVERAVHGHQTLVVKPKPGIILNEERTTSTRRVISDALGSIPVENVKQTKAGVMVLQFPNEAAKNDASAALADHINDDSEVVVSEPRKLLPKLTVTGIPLNISDDELVAQMRAKNHTIDSLVTSGSNFSLCFTKDKKVGDRVQSRIAVLKVSPEIRSVIMNNGGYIFLDLVRCKAYDRFWITQCFHCQKFGHMASDCPRKESSPVCCFCSGSHKGHLCTSKNSPNCANCSSEGSSVAAGSRSHFSFRNDCPYIKAQRQRVADATNFLF